MTRAALFTLPALRRARDLIDRDYAARLDLDAMARAAAYLTRRRIERAKSLLRGANLTVTEVCYAVGFESLGSFSRLFSQLVGLSPSAYRADSLRAGGSPAVPGCFVMMWTRPRPDAASREKPPAGGQPAAGD